jgi:hypothetical protein
MLRLVVALVLIFVFSSIAIGMLRSFQTRPGAKVLDEPLFIDAGSRIVFRCQECGTEVLLLVRGSEAPPRHCGERMHEREEISRS